MQSLEETREWRVEGKQETHGIYDPYYSGGVVMARGSNKEHLSVKQIQRRQRVTYMHGLIPHYSKTVRERPILRVLYREAE